MFGWLDRAWNWATGRIGGDVVNWVRDVLHGVWGFLHLIFGNVGDAWHNVWLEVNSLWKSAGHLASSIWGAIHYVLFHVIPSVYRWAVRELAKLGKFILDIYHWALRELDRLRKWINHLISTTIHWVITHIWDPLFRSIEMAWKWLRHEGSILWFYLTHPDKLVDLLWKSLLAAIELNAWSAGQLLGRFFLALILHNVKRFALLIEDIISAVL